MSEAKLKPFDLSAALAGKPVITRDGRKVTQIHKFDIEDVLRVYAIVEKESGVLRFKENGSFFSNHTSNLDLFMAPTTREVWVNLYDQDNPLMSGGSLAVHHPTELAADAVAGESRIGGKAHKIVIEE